jgi:hypothetical protein
MAAALSNLESHEDRALRGGRRRRDPFAERCAVMLFEAESLIEGEGFSVIALDLELERPNSALCEDVLGEADGCSTQPASSMRWRHVELRQRRLPTAELEIEPKSQNEVADGGVALAEQPGLPEGVIAEELAYGSTYGRFIERNLVEIIVRTDQWEEGVHIPEGSLMKVDRWCPHGRNAKGKRRRVPLSNRGRRAEGPRRPRQCPRPERRRRARPTFRITAAGRRLLETLRDDVTELCEEAILARRYIAARWTGRSPT